jgi:hypothetical protein
LEGILNFVYAYVGALDRVLENPERDLELRDMAVSLDALWQRESASLRHNRRPSGQPRVEDRLHTLGQSAQARSLVSS